ncbi:hypothetical protein CLU81_0541 [Flavobacterium sp. 9]|uniref:hypothetical protein n=1 Tax=Flavobacterium sp. 9 TaxID=2035198 RepID=UPI000C3E5195|nr:hypothetical protein [Flavobacterium sp. 9]PIF30137.1 hypothetical protein CLU81_0541 [Flavobacterium sp. 9]
MTMVDSKEKAINADFEIERTDYLYLVFEVYNGTAVTSKYALPKNVSELIIKYELDLLSFSNLTGIFDKKKAELQIFNLKKNPVVFLIKDVPTAEFSQFKAIENKIFSNWTYPGKDLLIKEDYEPDEPASEFIFKFKIENSLKAAIAVTKSEEYKFLVVVTDNKNPAAKTDFDTFIKIQEEEHSGSMWRVELTDGALMPTYDLYNFYLATADDKSWLLKNKITNTPSLMILNNNGDVLATAKYSTTQKINQIYDVCNLYGKLKIIDALLFFYQTVKNKKTTDAALILAFKKAATIYEAAYGNNDETSLNENFANFKMTKVVTLQEKEVVRIWKELIESHQKDTTLNKDLVVAILNEINNDGFYRRFFNKDRVLDKTDFLAIDYLLKHYDAIEKMKPEFLEREGMQLFYGSLSSKISYVLRERSFPLEYSEQGKVKEVGIYAVYKKMMAMGKMNFECYRDYFEILNRGSDSSIDDLTFLKEFKSYFNSYLSTGKEKQNPVNYANLANSAAWLVVLKATNSSFIKDAITWSEYSLIIEKNNLYYLDTLAQLYYKNGQKQKAIRTQTLAVNFLDANVDRKTASEMRETLNKMQNDNY